MGSEMCIRDRANILKNKQTLCALGLESAANAVRASTLERRARPTTKRVAPATMPVATRRSKRTNRGDPNSSTDEQAELDAILEQAEAEKNAPEKPPQRWLSWVHTEYDSQTPLTPEELEKIAVPEDWIEDFESFLFRELVLSDANAKKVMQQVSSAAASCFMLSFGQTAHSLLKLAHWHAHNHAHQEMGFAVNRLLNCLLFCQVRKLASGEGLTSRERDGVFCEERFISPATDLEALAHEAYIWLPMKSIPAFLAHKYPPAPPGGPRDRSNGWFANHPISKLCLYQRLLRDQAKEIAAVEEAARREAYVVVAEAEPLTEPSL